MNHNFSNNLFLFVAMLLTLGVAADSSAQESELRWYKGNLHTHSLWSDGDDFPDMIVKWYVDHDYQFLALTDHNILSNGENWMSADAITTRGGKNVIDRYLKTFGNEVVEIREQEGVKEVRLRTFAECKKHFDKSESFMLLTGEEISDSVDGLPLHMNATNLQRLLRPTGGVSMREAMRANLRAARIQANDLQREILVHLNHPNFGWAITAEDLAAVVEEKFFEVYNGHPDVNQSGDADHPSVERLWDIVNTLRTDKLDTDPLMGLATDDCHYYHGRKGSQPGRGWIMVRSKELAPESILHAINAGEFYASSGVEIEDFSFDADSGKLDIKIKPIEGVSFETKFVGTETGYDATSKPRTDSDGKPIRSTRIYSADIGKVLAIETGNSVSYQMNGNELYVRATVTSSKSHPNPSTSGQKEQAWIQPVVWKK